MSFKHLSLLALASYALAQNTTVPTLEAALASTASLSALSGVLAMYPNLLGTLNGATDITILAPSNDAFGAVDNATLTSLTANEGLITALLQYHVLNGSYPASAVTNTSTFIPTYLTNPLFTNVTGGQVVDAVSSGDNVTFYSGLLSNSSVTTANVNFTGGIIHIIDRLLVLPEVASDTLSALGLTSVRGALNRTNLVETVNTTPNITIFAPSNEAFQSIGSALGNLTTEDLTDILTYHCVAGTIGYSSGLENGTELETVNGESLTITLGQNGSVFVNNARVITADILIANGVVHVIDELLNPSNDTAANPTATGGAPVFPGASSVSEAPFTSGQANPTTTVAPAATSNQAPGQTTTSSSRAAAAPTGVVGMGALLGAAAVYLL
ncbi:Fasciclin-domain-containing protein [Dothidotthia symphoricarpi CBS 119687]|uniref:Fasciclin-domain-containing protein n=1 Tax=Dothidotthia symphoricarpi CBS 119687 TaxID=1392245 RepID=A0A6A6ANF9_9PLEO|nr:Fasciclin-domain-containing protein [Dothidotthia symphoricarpi CBS 119687]KAF2133532.1 Fasciclin-domain-containing protein [Dothidotthia symphoricarpi CBS 119687]